MSSEDTTVEIGDDCPHCEPNHGSPHRCAWGVWVAPEVDSDGQPTHLRVQPTAGAHVAQADADWLFALIRDRVCVHRDGGLLVHLPVEHDDAECRAAFLLLRNMAFERTRERDFLRADLEGWRSRQANWEATLEASRNSAVEDIRVMDQLRARVAELTRERKDAGTFDLRELPAVVRGTRRERGLSLRGLAAATDTSINTLSKFERGGDIKLSTAVKLIEWLSVPGSSGEAQ